MLIIKDLGPDPATRPEMFVPTTGNIVRVANEKLKQENFANADFEAAMADDYKPEYAKLVGEMQARGFKEWRDWDVEEFRGSYEGFKGAPNAELCFRDRNHIHTQLGANHYFSGDGCTKLLGDGPRAKSVREVLALDPAPKSIGEYKGAGQLVALECKPLL